MTTLIVAVVLFVGLLVLIAVWHRWYHQMGGRSYGPFKRSDGGMTVGATGYAEEMKGHGKVISPSDRKAG